METECDKVNNSNACANKTQNNCSNTIGTTNNNVNASHINTAQKFSNGRNESTPFQQVSSFPTTDGTFQPPTTNSNRRESYPAYNEVDPRTCVDYTNVWHQNHQSSYGQPSWAPTIPSNRNYSNNIPKYSCSNRIQSFQNPRQIYMQFNPYIAQRTIISSQNQHLQHRNHESNDNQTNLRLGEYDYSLH